ncbi:MAG TPA: hypothetical protein VHD90_09550 [Phototrophicaceae bacterium]|nr:hypothetical protein [Phototrophicaceae bacterium]
MTDQPPQEPDWLDDFEDLANRELADGSSCEQVHPIVERWYRQLMQREPPASRDSVLQALACLSTEVLYDSPEDIRREILKHVDEDSFARWIEYVLMIGRSFEIALRSGDLDDL